jgi:hypothetical protein
MADTIITLVERMQYAKDETEQERYKIEQTKKEIERLDKAVENYREALNRQETNYRELEHETQSLRLSQKEELARVDALRLENGNIAAQLKQAYTLWNVDEKELKKLRRENKKLMQYKAYYDERNKHTSTTKSK